LLVGTLGCGGGQQPMLANVPHPNNAAMAGGAAAAAAAITLASPDSAAQKPEKNQNQEKHEVDVKESVPSDVLDRLDQPANGAGATQATPEKKQHPAKGTPGKIPTPAQAVGNDPIKPHPDAP